MSRLLAVFVLLLVPLSARAQAALVLAPPTTPAPSAVVRPLHPPPDDGPPPLVTQWEAIAFELELRMLYLTALEAGRGRHVGPEVSLGMHVTLAPSWAIVVRGRAALAFDEQTPTVELDDTRCAGGYYFTLCGGDTDMRFPTGAELGVRATHVEPIFHDFAVAFAGELAGSGTVYENSYEHLTRSGGLGGAASVRGELRFRRWTIGLLAGGRIEGSLDGRGVWAGVFGGFELAIRL